MENRYSVRFDYYMKALGYWTCDEMSACGMGLEYGDAQALARDLAEKEDLFENVRIVDMKTGLTVESYWMEEWKGHKHLNWMIDGKRGW